MERSRADWSSDRDGQVHTVSGVNHVQRPAPARHSGPAQRSSMFVLGGGIAGRHGLHARAGNSRVGRGPQSAQSVPSSHPLFAEKRPPSLQTPFSASEQLFSHTSASQVISDESISGPPTSQFSLIHAPVAGLHESTVQGFSSPQFWLTKVSMSRPSTFTVSGSTHVTRRGGSTDPLAFGSWSPAATRMLGPPLRGYPASHRELRHMNRAALRRNSRPQLYRGRRRPHMVVRPQCIHRRTGRGLLGQNPRAVSILLSDTEN